MYFWWNLKSPPKPRCLKKPRKTQDPPEITLEPKIRSKNPRSWEKIQNKKPKRATEETPQNPRSNFYAIGLHFGKKSNFSRKNPTFPEKSVSFPPKFLMTFLVINSKLRKQQLILYFFSKKTLAFSKKHSKTCIFRGSLRKRKTLGVLKKPRQNPRPPCKKPKIPRSGWKNPDLGRKP